MGDALEKLIAGMSAGTDWSPMSDGEAVKALLEQVFEAVPVGRTIPPWMIAATGWTGLRPSGPGFVAASVRPTSRYCCSTRSAGFSAPGNRG